VTPPTVPSVLSWLFGFAHWSYSGSTLLTIVPLRTLLDVPPCRTTPWVLALIRLMAPIVDCPKVVVK
jgi:hypothetical protein